MDQSTLSQKLIDETHTAYESTISVLHATINRLQRFVSSNFHGPEILQLTKEIHRLLFNTTIPDNHQLADVLKTHFQEVCAKVDDLKQCLEEAPGLNSSIGEVKKTIMMKNIINPTMLLTKFLHSNLHRNHLLTRVQAISHLHWNKKSFPLLNDMRLPLTSRI